MSDEKSEEVSKRVIELPEELVVAIVDTLAHLPYGQVYDLVHTISRLVHEQREAREPEIYTGETP